MASGQPAQAVRIVVAGPGSSNDEHVYQLFPIRIGRNPLNELVLDDPHVSQWHAIIGHVEGTLRLLDVGSRNGTKIAGRRLGVGEAVILGGDENVVIGPFTLAFAPTDEIPTAEAHAPRAAGPLKGIGDATLVYHPPDRSNPVVVACEADLRERLKPFYLAFLRDWGALCEEARTQIRALSPPDRAAVLARLRADFPAHQWEEEFAELRATPSLSDGSPGDVGREALNALDELATHLLRRKQPLKTVDDVRTFTRRLAQVLDVFVEHTHNLFKGAQKLEWDMALKLTGRDPSPVERAQNARDLAVRLMDFTADRNNRAPYWLASAFKNVMIQQVALVSGAMEGVRTLLGHLSPDSIEEEVRSSGGLANLALRARALWRTYVDRHRRLSEEDQATFDAIFGKQLSRACIELVGEGYTGERTISSQG